MTERRQMTATTMHFEVPIKKGACDWWPICMLSTSFQKSDLRKASLDFSLKISRYIQNLFRDVSVSICKPHNTANCFLPLVLHKSLINSTSFGDVVGKLYFMQYCYLAGIFQFMDDCDCFSFSQIVPWNKTHSSAHLFYTTPVHDYLWTF